MRIGSLFSGAGGLDMAVEQVFGGEVIWQSEIDKAASKVLAHRWPSVPNLGSITEIDWAAVEPVDVLCGGFPCQDVSAAGKRAGIKDGTRSGLWAVFADAIDALRPQWVVIENVRGLLSGTAHRTVELTDATLGNGQPLAVLRAAGAVLGDLADIGYDARWATVAASSVGAPHRRERVFVLASDTDQVRPEGSGLPNGMVSALSQPGCRDLSLCGTCGHEQRLHCDWIGRCTTPCECLGFATPDPTRNGWNEGRPESARIFGGFDAAVSGDEPGRVKQLRREYFSAVQDGDYFTARQIQEELDSAAVSGDEPAVALLPTPVSRDHKGRNQRDDDSCLTGALLPTPALDNGWCEQCWVDYDSPSCLCDEYGYVQRPALRTQLLCTPSAADSAGGHLNRSGDRRHEQLLPGQARDMDGQQWGKYAPAITRWESLTRPAPAPTEPNKNGNPRLSAAFSEWLMGWPPGWVTDPDIGISRNDQLKIVGNGVCPQQAVAALRYLLQIAVAA